MATISTSGIAVGQIIRSEHLLRVINALNGTTPIDIKITGSLAVTGSLSSTGSAFLKGLPNTSRANVITYDPTTGQLSYLASASLGVTMSVSQPGGSDTQIQYNSGSALNGNSSFRFIYNSSSLTLGTSTPTGLYSFTQGSNLTASGNFSYAQGSGNKATNISAHAEGESTLASGIGSHAEGNTTTSSGNYSHTEGLGTIAIGDYQHIQGQYNISSSAQSAFILGNGTSAGSRSNLIHAAGSIVQVSGSIVVGNNDVAGNVTIYNTYGTPHLTLSRPNGDSIFNFYNGSTVSPNVIDSINSNYLDINSTNQLRLSTVGQSRFSINQSGTVTINPTGSLTGSIALVVTGSSSFTGSVSISDVLTLTPRTTTPTPTTGMIIISGSGANQHIYCYLNSTWKQLD